ncbi:MAG: transglycosylase family protein [Acidimicrobiales bacterium]
MSDARASAVRSAGRPARPGPSIRWAPCRLLGPAALAGASLVVALAGAPRISGAATLSSLQSQATELGQQLIHEQLQVNGFEAQYETLSVRVSDDDAMISAIDQQVVHDRAMVSVQKGRLLKEAVDNYVNAGTETLSGPLVLFGDDQSIATNRDEYETVAVGDTNVTLALLHVDEDQLMSHETELATRRAQDASAQQAALETLDSATAVSTQLARNQTLVKGQLAVAIAGDREQRAITAAQSRPDPGGALSDPPLPPFLQCVVHYESGGNYQAVSPDGLFMGAFQFSQATWNQAAELAGLPDLVGVPPNQASKAAQDTLAIALYDADGSQPWYDPCSNA